ncbi:DUF695 domain-containing protein [Henriciella litoralis]|uniref:DUF695 domain-containing protein n=1 Tax=Henriciella litoralis TaxID=568102 RepID=UPI000A03A287|nr:DUF695 domain-containing protein [Henriciella litoralis]
MSDNWGLYFADMAGHPASIVFDDGISDDIDKLPHSFAFRLRLGLRSARPDGLTTDEEAETLDQIQRELEASLGNEGGILLGRVTTNGIRWMLGLLSSEQSEASLSRLFAATGYEFDLFVEPDPEKSVYWDDLYPDPDSRQVLKDMLVLEQLSKKGDKKDAVHAVQHWTYFKTKQGAEAFCNWLEAAGYQPSGVEKRGKFFSPEWLVRSHHDCTMKLDDITHHTIKHRRQAEALSGVYDGWETRIENGQGGS